jgi:hypothetical protein
MVGSNSMFKLLILQISIKMRQNKEKREKKRKDPQLNQRPEQLVVFGY